MNDSPPRPRQLPKPQCRVCGALLADRPEASVCAELRCVEEQARRDERAAYQATLTAALRERRAKPPAAPEGRRWNGWVWK